MKRAGLIFLSLWLLAACGEPPAPTRAADPAQPPTIREDASMFDGLGAFAHVTVGVADLDQALALWRDTFGMEVLAERAGPDQALAGMWNIEPDRIRRQALLRTPGLTSGAMHFVEFRDPAPSVRAGAEVFDRLPKNLDVYTEDLPAKYDSLSAQGIQFRARWVEMPGPDGLTFREVQLPGHDDTNVSLLEIIDTEHAYSPLGYAAIGPLVTVVEDAEIETLFYTKALGLQDIMQDLLSGPDVERMIGLPPGAGVDFRVLGDADDPMGRIEIIEYQQTRGADRYARARPPATGTLHVTWQIPDLAPLRANLEAWGVPFTEHGEVDALFGTGAMISFYSPGGFRIEVQQSGR